MRPAGSRTQPSSDNGLLRERVVFGECARLAVGSLLAQLATVRSVDVGCVHEDKQPCLVRGTLTLARDSGGTVWYDATQSVQNRERGAMADGGTRFNVQLDKGHAMRLRALAERTHVNPGTLARSLLSTALDEVEPEPSTIVALLDSIPTAFERANQGLREVRLGEGIPLDEF